MFVAGSATHKAIIQGSGTVGFEGCIFNLWDTNSTGQYAIVANGTGSVIITSNDFQHNANQVSLGPQLTSAVITSNLFVGAQRIAGLRNSTYFQVGLNAYLN